MSTIDPGVTRRVAKDPASLYGTALVWQPTNNTSRYRDEQFTELVQQAATTVDPAERREIYRQITEIIRAQKFVLPVSPNLRPWASQPGVNGLEWSVDGMLILENAWIEE